MARLNNKPTPETDAGILWIKYCSEYLEMADPDTCRRLECERDEAREQRDRLAEALNDLWHHYSLTDAAYALIDAALTSVERGADAATKKD